VQQGADMLAQLGLHWGWVLSFGILTLLAGIAVRPGRGPRCW
jgi:hypothetical protein